MIPPTYLLLYCYILEYFLLLIDFGRNDYYFKRVTKQATKQQSIQIIASFKTMEHQLPLLIYFHYSHKIYKISFIDF